MLSYGSIAIQLAGPRQLAEERVYWAYSFRGRVYSHYGGKHGRRHVDMVLEQNLSPYILVPKLDQRENMLEMALTF